MKMSIEQKAQRKADREKCKAWLKERSAWTEAQWYAEWKQTEMCCLYGVWRSMQGVPIQKD